MSEIDDNLPTRELLSSRNQSHIYSAYVKESRMDVMIYLILILKVPVHTYIGL